MSTDGPAAHDILLSFAPLQYKGSCWYYVWQAYAKAGASTGLGTTRTAYLGSLQTQGMHHGDMNPPAGAAIWLGKRTSDGNLDGDVFIAGAADGQHAATDQPTWGRTGLTSIAARMALTGREYIGWSDHVLDCPIILGSAPAPALQPQQLVKDEQSWMNASRGEHLVVDGLIGPLTVAAIKRYQTFLRAYGYAGAIDGIWGAGTQAAHARYYAAWTAPAPKTGALTYADIQRGLNEFGYGLVVDGVWGPKSHNALGDFQRRHGLTVDYIVGPKTRAALGI